MQGLMSRTQLSSLAGAAFAVPAILFGIVFFGAPMALAAFMSLFDWPLFGEPTFNTGSNYLRAASDPVFRNSFLFVAVFTVGVTAATMACGLGLAVLVQRGRPGISVIRSALMLPVAFGLPTVAFMWIWLLNADVGIIAQSLEALGIGKDKLYFLSNRTSAAIVVALVTVWKSAGFAMILYLVGLQAIPLELGEAAEIDGATPWQRFVSITLPLLAPSTALISVLLFTQNILAFEQFYLLTRGGPANSTITPVYWVYNAGFIRFQLGYAAALSVILLVLLLAFNALQLRILRRQA
jgi:multiple sugar transport system permease protein